MQHKWGSELLSACDAIWHRRTSSTLVRVLACCLMTLSHLLNHYWHILTSLWLCGIQLITFLHKLFILTISELSFNLKLQQHSPGTNEHGELVAGKLPWSCFHETDTKVIWNIQACSYHPPQSIYYVEKEVIYSVMCPWKKFGEEMYHKFII